MPSDPRGGGSRARAYALTGSALEEDPACTYQPTGKRLEQSGVVWSEEARERLERIPIVFIRDKVKLGLEAYAQRKSTRLITAEMMKEALPGEGRPEAFRNMPSFLTRSKHK